MIAPLQKYKITLFGETHVVVSDDPESILLSSVTLLDSLMKDIAQQTHCTDTKQLALLAALNLAQQQIDGQFKLMHLIDDELLKSSVRQEKTC